MKRTKSGKESKVAEEDSRVQRSKQLILRTTWSLLSDSGLSGVSIDEVSRKSGVAKTTIYRHWKTRADLLIDACSQVDVAQVTPDTGSLQKDLEQLTTELAHLLKTARWASVVPSVVDSAEREPEIAELHGRLQRTHSKPFREVIKRAVKRGDLPAKTDVDAMTALLIGPLYYRRWFTRENLDSKFVKTVLKTVLK